MTRKSTNPKKIYESISMAGIDKNWFDQVHPVTMTGKIGNLMPCLVLPVLPGSEVSIEYDLLVRFPNLVAPAMVRFDCYIHTFYVPTRILWPGFDDWFQGEAGYTHPYITIDSGLTAARQKFLDYFGIPPIADSTAQEALDISPLAICAYQKIYNDYYRPRPFQDPVNAAASNNGGDQTPTIPTWLVMRQRAWEHDYFSSMLPEPMVAPDVTLGIGDVALKANWESVVGAKPNWVNDAGSAAAWVSSPGNQMVNNDTTIVPAADAITYANAIGGAREPAAYDPDGSLEVAATTINELRLAYARQRYLEKMGRSGGEYYEIIMALYNERIPDARLQRAEYITGMQAPVIINPVLQTANDANTEVGQQYGHAVAVGDGGRKNYYCPEHGFVIGIMSVVPKPVYKQGIERHFRAFTREDYVIPDLANIGEQPVYSWEIAAYEEVQDEITTLGYMPNYTDRKQKLARIAGEFRSSLGHYVVVKEYAGVPTLDLEFVQVQEDIADHIFVTDSFVNDPLWINVLNIVHHKLPLPVYSDPI